MEISPPYDFITRENYTWLDLKFEQDLCSSQITTLDNNKRCKNLTNGAWSSAQMQPALSRNEHAASNKFYFEVTMHFVKRTSDGIMVGVAKQFGNPNETNHYIKPHSYSYYSHNGSIYHNQTSVAYKRPLHSSDRLGVLLDMDRGELAFAINGVNQGMALQDELLREGPLFPTVHIYYVNQTVSLMDMPLEMHSRLRKQEGLPDLLRALQIKDPDFPPLLVRL